jgi:hypothetical protein
MGGAGGPGATLAYGDVPTTGTVGCAAPLTPLAMAVLLRVSRAPGGYCVTRSNYLAAFTLAASPASHAATSTHYSIAMPLALSAARQIAIGAVSAYSCVVSSPKLHIHPFSPLGPLVGLS